MNYSIIQLLEKAFHDKASDLHITVGLPPVFRQNGALQSFGEDVLDRNDTSRMLKEILSDNKREEFEEKGEIDFSYELQTFCRFRINAYMQQNQISIAARMIASAIPTLEELGMPSILYSLADKPQGLILVTGPTGSGKSTTLAAMINYINKTKSKHVITLEDPIEYVHTHDKSIINQRAVGTDTLSFANGLRAALRQDPDVILVGEMRDLGTISTAITAAETGHLVMATLHTSSAPTTIDRIIDVFPASQQGQIRIQLANVLQGIVSQRLFVRTDGKGRVAASEILLQTPSISNLIRNEKVHQINNILQTSRALGMQTLDSSIQELLLKRIITLESAKPFMNVGEY